MTLQFGDNWSNLLAKNDAIHAVAKPRGLAAKSLLQVQAFVVDLDCHVASATYASADQLQPSVSQAIQIARGPVLLRFTLAQSSALPSSVRTSAHDVGGYPVVVCSFLAKAANYLLNEDKLQARLREFRCHCIFDSRFMLLRPALFVGVEEFPFLAAAPGQRCKRPLPDERLLSAPPPLAGVTSPLFSFAFRSWFCASVAGLESSAGAGRLLLWTCTDYASVRTRR